MFTDTTTDLPWIKKKRICQGLPDAVDKQTPNSLYTPYHPRIEKITLAVHIAVFLMVNGGLFYHIDMKSRKTWPLLPHEKRLTTRDADWAVCVQKPNILGGK